MTSTSTPIYGRLLPQPGPPAPSSEDLAWIARDAAERAAALLEGNPPPTHPMVDTIRLLVSCGDSTLDARVTDHTGIRPGELRRLRTAHALGGLGAVRAMLETHEPMPGVMEEALIAIQQVRANGNPSLSIDGNHITDDSATLQIRLGRDRLWYPFISLGDDRWTPARGHCADPADAFAAAIAARRSRRT